MQFEDRPSRRLFAFEDRPSKRRRSAGAQARSGWAKACSALLSDDISRNSAWKHRSVALPTFWRHRRPQEMTLGFVCSHRSLDKRSLRRSRAAASDGLYVNHWGPRKWTAASRRSQEIYNIYLQNSFLIYNIFYCLRKPQKSKVCANYYMQTGENEKGVLKSSLFFKLPTTAARQQCMLSLCPPPPATCILKSATQGAQNAHEWKMRNKAETDK